MIQKTKTILLVEDNRQDELLTLRALTQHKVCNGVNVARDGEEALKYLRENEDLPQLVLLDLKLPKVDGLQVLKALREDPRTRLLPVVVLTTSKEDADVVASYKLGANSYVRKPVDFQEFTEAVRQLGLYWLILNEGPPKG